jgi:hypothetical protein
MKVHIITLTLSTWLNVSDFTKILSLKFNTRSQNKENVNWELSVFVLFHIPIFYFRWIIKVTLSRKKKMSAFSQSPSPYNSNTPLNLMVSMANLILIKTYYVHNTNCTYKGTRLQNISVAINANTGKNIRMFSTWFDFTDSRTTVDNTDSFHSLKLSILKNVCSFMLLRTINL